MTAAPPTTSTRMRLIEAAGQLFQQDGYHATSVNDVLSLAGVPKGSLYHHFPGGKADLALAAAQLASDLTLDITTRSYGPADTFAEGTVRFAEKFARLFERHPHWRACPVQTLFLDGPLGVGSGQAKAFLDLWIAAMAKEAERLGQPQPEAMAQAVWTSLIGCWTLARANDDADDLRRLPQLLGLTGALPPRG